MSEKNDDDPLPCNQIEYLDSAENSAASIPGSPGVLENSVLRNIENWESLVLSKQVSGAQKENSMSLCRELSELEDISEEMFVSKLDDEPTQTNPVKTLNNHENITLLTSNCEKHFREYIEESFDIVNQSICNQANENANKSSLFESKDSFLLDIKESGKGVCEEEVKKSIAFEKLVDKNTFYGLPLTAKGLFKTYRNIEKLYDWQEECLNLDAIKERRNLIYALPTSGGKTLVAEVLMLREVLNNSKNALFILPFVAIVQEKIWSLSPFAVQLDFLVEEYTGGKGHIPPKKRRNKNSIYIATIEKGLALVRSLIELDRLSELGLVVVDELHLIGEQGRGATLETLLTTIMFTKKDIQLVGMSATIGNLADLARFLHADVFTREFRPVELTEYVKLGDVLHKLVWGKDGLEVVPDRQLAFDYTAAGASLDPDYLGGLVAEAVPRGSCLVFCPTKRNCENVATLLCKLQRKEMVAHRSGSRAALESALRAEGGGAELCRAVRCGVAYHHAGLAPDERLMLEHAFRSGVISVICCTSTLAAGVNLPASRVLIRAPRVGREPLSLAQYRQMAGRAARAGLCTSGESIIICSAGDWPSLQSVLRGGLCGVRSVLRGPASGAMLLSAAATKLASTRQQMHLMMAGTLLATETTSSPINIKEVCDDAIRSLIQDGALEVVPNKVRSDADSSHVDGGNCIVYNNTELRVSGLGLAAVKGCLDLSAAKQALGDLEVASRGLVVMGGLHLLYLVTPHDAPVRPDYAHYYSLYTELDEEGVQTARTLGITENNAIRMITGKPITSVSEMVLCRFYLALMLRDLWRQVPCDVVVHKYCVSRGIVHSVLQCAVSLSCSLHKVCLAVPERWQFAALLAELSARLQHCAAPEVAALMELPAVHKARAMQLLKAGYKRIEDLAKASAQHLTANIAHLSRKAANQLISAARMMLIEKVENLRCEAEEVMEELNT